MPVEQKLPDNHPLVVAFEAWITSDAGKNAANWATKPEHTQGSLWAAFRDAWNSSPKGPERTFPILKTPEGGPRRIPWAMIEVHAEQAKINHQQTLEELASRGGLDCCEAVCVLTDRRFPSREELRPITVYRDKLIDLVRNWNPAPPDLSREVAELRLALAIAHAGASLYTDDGELQDATHVPFIDWKRDSWEQIKASLLQRNLARLAAATNAASVTDEMAKRLLGFLFPFVQVAPEEVAKYREGLRHAFGVKS